VETEKSQLQKEEERPAIKPLEREEKPAIRPLEKKEKPARARFEPLEKEEEPVAKPLEKEGKGPSGCPHDFGYLAKRPKDAPIPQECLVCSRIMDCMLKPRSA